MGSEVFVGLGVTAHNNALRATSTVDSIGLTGDVDGWVAPTGASGLTPVYLGTVSLNDGFWKPRIDTNRTVSIPMIRQALIDNHTLDNFPKAAGLMGGYHDGFMWADGDTYGLVEAMAYALELHPDGALESQMEGKSIGDEFKATVAPEQAYGVRRDDLVAPVSRESFKGIADIKPGMQFQANTPQGPRVVTVTAVEGDEVTIDANHELAGKTLIFDVKVVAVRAATPEELSHGHAHGAGGHQH
jgi:FKBP-type peptidyl-prolyl cis-trans isomerase SlyD